MIAGSRHITISLIGIFLSCMVLSALWENGALAEEGAFAEEDPQFSIDVDEVWPLCLLDIEGGKEDQKETQKRISQNDWDLVLVTNDDPYSVESSQFWCRAAVDAVLRRSGFTGRRYWIPAGLPSSLLGRQAVTPSVACFLVDSENRIGGFCKGLPSMKQFKQLKADSTSAFNLFVVPSRSVGDEVEKVDLWDQWLAHCGRRVDQYYRRMIAEHRQWLISSDPEERQTVHTAEFPVMDDLIVRMNQVLIDDAPQRFTLEPQAMEELAGWEQHAETREAWCLSVMPSVVGKKLESCLSDLGGVLFWQSPFVLPYEIVESANQQADGEADSEELGSTGLNEIGAACERRMTIAIRLARTNIVDSQPEDDQSIPTDQAAEFQAEVKPSRRRSRQRPTWADIKALADELPVFTLKVGELSMLQRAGLLSDIDIRLAREDGFWLITSSGETVAVTKKMEIGPALARLKRYARSNSKISESRE